MRMFQLLKASLAEPKKQAAARILPVGKILQFVFLFIAFLTILSFFELLRDLDEAALGMDGLTDYTSDIGWLLYPFGLIMLFVTTTVYHFTGISIFALVGLGFLAIRKKKGEYRHMWRTAALAATGPTLLATVLSILSVSFWILAATMALTLVLLWIDAGWYPNRPPSR